MKAILLLFLFPFFSLYAYGHCRDTVTYQTQTTCEGTTVDFNGTPLTAAGTYNDTIVLNGGCDSIISMQLFVIPTVYTHDTGLLCGGAPYDFYGQSLTQPGIYYDTLFATGTFCDSIIIMTLMAGGPVPRRTIYDTLCTGNVVSVYGIGWGLGSHAVSIPDPSGGCDSVITINIIDGRKYSYVEYTGCIGQILEWQGKLYNVPGEYLDTTLISVSGCDSFVYLELNQLMTYKFLSIAECGSVSYNGHTYNSAGIYIDTFNNTSGGGCDTIGYVFVSSISPARVYLYSCSDSAEYDGITYAVPGFYADTIRSGGGICDSVILLQFFSGTPDGFEQIGFCSGQTFIHHGHIDSLPGNYFDTLTSVWGCDSIVWVDAYYGFKYSEMYVNGCVGRNYLYNGQNYAIPGSYTVTIPLPSGCDSLVYLYLDANIPSYVSYTGCMGDTFIYDGHLLTFPSFFIDTFISSGGCDSIVNVTLYEPTGYVSAYGVCGQPYIFNGNAFQVPGTYFDTMPSSIGCDSIVILTLNSNYLGTYNDTIYLSSCTDVLIYNFNNIIYGFPSSGFYALGYTGCDTMHYAHVTLNAPFYQESVSRAICPGASFTFRGVTYSVPSNFDYSSLAITYHDTVFSSSGCDSIFTIVLDVFPPPPPVYISDSFCEGTAYQYRGYGFTAAGLDTVYLPGSIDCDTVVYLNLSYTYMPAPVISGNDTLLTVDVLSGVSYQWLLNGQTIAGATGRSYVPLTGGAYTVIVTMLIDSGCFRVSAPYIISGISGPAESTSGFVIYPNPNTGAFTIETQSYIGAGIKVYDVLGRVVYEGTLPEAIERLDLDMADGTYICILRKDNSVTYGKLIISR